MKYLLFIFCLLFAFSCHNSTIEKNYFVSKNGGYFEVYFKKDSMRMAYDNHWVGQSEWRKIAIKKDTLYFKTFGEWSHSTKAVIEQKENNSIELHFLDSSRKLKLEPINEEINFENEKDFWNGFYNRKKVNRKNVD